MLAPGRGLRGATLGDMARIGGSGGFGIAARLAGGDDLKASLAGVPETLLAHHGPVSAEVAQALATGVRERLGADWGLSTTGVAGPEPQDGVAVGTVFVGVSSTAGVRSVRLRLPGTRQAVRDWTTVVAWDLLRRSLDGSGSGPGEHAL